MGKDYRLRRAKTIFIGLLCSAISLLLYVPEVSAAHNNNEMELLRLFYEDKDLVFSATRSNKTITHVAENMSVITAEEIGDMNAHTVSEVLSHVTGVQVEQVGVLGTLSYPLIQGSDYRHVLVLVDGIAINSLSEGLADIGTLPVHNIERIEVIKGPASSAWGSSLGGVINIITKPTGETLKPALALSGSYGEAATGDYRAEASGKIKAVGYYIAARSLRSGGFFPNRDAEIDNLYMKLNAEITDDTSLLFTLEHDEGTRGFGEFPDYDLSAGDEFENLISSLSLNTRMGLSTALDFSLKRTETRSSLFYNLLSTGEELSEDTYDEKTNGGSIRLTSKLGHHEFVAGADYEKGWLESSNMGENEYTQTKWAVYTNDTIEVQKFALTPGIRYDNISIADEFVSPSLGLTYELGEDILIRADLARGFSAPSLSSRYGDTYFYNPNPDLDVEKVWSYQFGVESSVLEKARVKATAFWHDVTDAISSQEEADGTYTKVNTEKVRRKGIELELESTPVFNISLKAGFLLQDVRDRETDDVVDGTPKETMDIGLKYADENGFKGLLIGHNIRWNEGANWSGAEDFVWDLNLSKELTISGMDSKVFVTVHNILNGSQYYYDLYMNPERWAEAGIKISF